MKKFVKSAKKLWVFIALSIVLLFGIQEPYYVEAVSRTITYDDGDYYVGNVNEKTGDKSGSGKYYCSNGVVIKGVWKNNLLTGRAIVRYPNKEKYTGYYKNDKRNGMGVYNFKNGDRYKGNWINDKMSGKGTYTWKNKNYVKGTWKNGKLHGMATLKKGNYLYSIKTYKGKLTKVYSRKQVG